MAIITLGNLSECVFSADILTGGRENNPPVVIFQLHKETNMKMRVYDDRAEAHKKAIRMNRKARGPSDRNERTQYEVRPLREVPIEHEDFDADGTYWAVALVDEYGEYELV